MLLCDKEIAIPRRLTFFGLYALSFLSFSGLFLGLLGFLLKLSSGNSSREAVAELHVSFFLTTFCLCQASD